MAVFSSNYTLYGDLSRRVMEVLGQFSPEVEPYSIDEAFVDLSGVPDAELPALGREIRRRVRQWTGIPVTIGIASSKTLAKIAAGVAKRDPAQQGVLSLVDYPELDPLLRGWPVEDIWGIGRGFADRLRQNGIGTAFQMKYANPERIRKLLNVQGMRSCLELRGESCLDLEEVEHGRKSLMFTRSFGHPVTKWAELEEAVSHYTARCAEKLRQRDLLTGMVTLYLREFDQPGSHLTSKSQASQPLEPATDFTPQIVHHTLQLGAGLFEEGKRYKKAGVFFTELVAKDQVQLSLFSQKPDPRHQKLMGTIDEINHRLGRGKVFAGKEGTEQHWQMKSEYRSPRYSTNWQDLLRIQI